MPQTKKQGDPVTAASLTTSTDPATPTPVVEDVQNLGAVVSFHDSLDSELLVHQELRDESPATFLASTAGTEIFTAAPGVTWNLGIDDAWPQMTEASFASVQEPSDPQSGLPLPAYIANSRNPGRVGPLALMFGNVAPVDAEESQNGLQHQEEGATSANPVDFPEFPGANETLPLGLSVIEMIELFPNHLSGIPLLSLCDRGWTPRAIARRLQKKRILSSEAFLAFKAKLTKRFREASKVPKAPKGTRRGAAIAENQEPRPEIVFYHFARPGGLPDGGQMEPESKAGEELRLEQERLAILFPEHHLNRAQKKMRARKLKADQDRAGTDGQTPGGNQGGTGVQ